MVKFGLKMLQILIDCYEASSHLCCNTEESKFSLLLYSLRTGAISIVPKKREVLQELGEGEKQTNHRSKSFSFVVHL